MKRPFLLAFLVMAFALPAAAGETPEATPPPGDTEFNNASLLFFHGEYQLAAADFTRFLEAFPGHPRASTARFHLGECRLELGDQAAAGAAYAALDRPDTPADLAAKALFRRGELAAGRGEYAAAAELFRRAAAEHPAHDLAGSALFRRGDALEQAGDAAAAEAAYRQLLESDPDCPFSNHARLNLGALALAGRRYDEARQWCEAALAAAPDGPLAAPARLNRAEALLGLGRAAEARADFEILAAGSGERRVRALMGVGRARELEGDFAAAAAAYREAAAAAGPDDPGAAGALLAAGEALRLAGRPAEALPLLEQAAARDSPRRDEAQLRLALAAAESGDVPRAIRVLEAAGGEGEFAPLLRYHLARLRHEAGDEAGALAVLDQLLAVAPPETAAEARYLKGTVLFAAARYADAEACFAALAGREDALYSAGLCRLRLNQAAAARAAFADCRERFPDGRFANQARRHLLELDLAAGRLEDVARAAAAWLPELARDPELNGAIGALRGAALLRLGQAAAAADQLAQAVAADPQPQVLLDLAEACRQSGRAEESLAALRRLQREFPGAPAVRRARLNEADLLFAAGDFNAALAAYQAAGAGESPAETAAAAAGAAWCLYRLDRTDEARPVFLAAAAAAPAGMEELAGESRFLAALCREGQPDYGAALEEALAGDPEGPFAARILSRLIGLARATGNAEKGRAYLERFAARWPEAPERDRAFFEGALLLAGGSAEDRGKARALLERVLAVPETPLAAEAHLQLGEILREAGDEETAADHYRQGAAAAGRERAGDSCWYRLGWFARRAGDDAAAADAFTALRSGWPASPLAAEAALLAAEALDRLGRAEEALAALTAVPAGDARRAEALLLKGTILARLHDWAGALAVAEEYLADFPAHDRRAEALYGQAQALFRLQRPAEALAAAAAAGAAAGPDARTAARARFLSGEVRFSRGEWDEAIREFILVERFGQEAITAAARLEAAKCHQRAGRLDRARQLLDQLLADFPGSAAAAAAAALRRELAEDGPGR